ncbi:MAG: DUF1667 domain-containing protein [Ezakiella sp.]|nr:DUF1667 domain-containing protein [Ezakiella sp.]MDD7761760.1 DUF1667 domain-containing protein [Bacillota bacterium]MDY3946575.1 DUF1667 domain-containing protein [Ezakiella sp.]
MQVTCKNCPIACLLTIKDGKVTGNRCSRGLSYGKDMQEDEGKSYFFTKIRIKNAPVGHLSIKSDIKIDDKEKEKLQGLISNMVIYAPVEAGQLVIYNLGESGVSFLAQRRVREL